MALQGSTALPRGSRPWWCPPVGMGDVDGWLQACREVAALDGSTVPASLYPDYWRTPGGQWCLLPDGSVAQSYRPEFPPPMMPRRRDSRDGPFGARRSDS